MLLALLLSMTIAHSAPTSFRFRIAEDRGTLDWGYGEVNQDVVLQLMDGLTRVDGHGAVVPAVAKSWKKTGSVYIFEIDSNARWSDGKAVCAQDFIDAWERARQPALASPYSPLLREVKEARAEGCGRLRVKLVRDVGYFAELVSHWVFFPIRKDLIEKYGKSWTAPANLVVTGPYRLKDWARDSKYVLERIRGNGPERIEAVVVPDDATALALFDSGKLDWIRDLPLLDRQRLSARNEFRVFPTLVEYHLGFRFGGNDALTRDQRCALSLAIDRAKIPEVLKGGEVPASSLSLSRAKSAKPVFSPAEARALWEKSPEKKITLHFYAKDIHVPLMEWLQEQWRKNLGAEVSLQKHEGKSYWSLLAKSPPPLFLSGTTGATLHPYSMLYEFFSVNDANWGKYSSKEYESAADAVARVERGPDSQKSFSDAEDTLLRKDCAIAPLYFRQTANLVSKRWKGFEMNPLARIDLRSLTFSE